MYSRGHLTSAVRRAIGFRPDSSFQGCRKSARALRGTCGDHLRRSCSYYKYTILRAEVKEEKIKKAILHYRPAQGSRGLAIRPHPQGSWWPRYSLRSERTPVGRGPAGLRCPRIDDASALSQTPGSSAERAREYPIRGVGLPAPRLTPRIVTPVTTTPSTTTCTLITTTTIHTSITTLTTPRTNTLVTSTPTTTSHTISYTGCTGHHRLRVIMVMLTMMITTCLRVVVIVGVVRGRVESGPRGPRGTFVPIAGVDRVNRLCWSSGS